MAERLTKDELQEVKVTFSELDTDGDGAITKTELVSILYEERCENEKGEKRKTSITDVGPIMDMLDVDHNGTVSFDEFSNIMALFRYDKLETPSDIKMMFNVLKKDADGTISVKEILRIWKLFMHPSEDISSKEMMDIIKDLDSDSDGKINYQEFVTHMSLDL